MNNNISYKKDFTTYIYDTLLKDIFVTYYRKKNNPYWTMCSYLF